MMSGGTMGVVENFEILQNSENTQEPGRTMIDAQLDEILNSLERDHQGQHNVQADEDCEPPPAKQPKLKKCIGNKVKQKKMSPVQNRVGYTSDGNSDIMSCDSNNVSPLGNQVLSPTTSSDGGDEVPGSCGKLIGTTAWTEHPLPPCRICGDRASGFHYGANTCEACKGFFRRSLKRKRAYRQSCAGSCPIGSSTRSGCAFCRYQKCISCGMSKTAIKTGRYTHEKKARDIEEVKKMKNEPFTGEQVPEEHLTGKDRETENFTKKLVATYDKFASFTRVNHQEKDLKINDYLEKRQMQEQLFGYLPPLSMEQYKDFYKTTGIDIDGRREMITKMFERTDCAIKRYIEFCKGLPRFDELVMEDQIALIKAARWDFRLLVMHRSMNTEAKVFMSVDMNTIVHRDDFVRMGRGWADIVDTMFQVAGRMQRLQLHDIEVAFLKAIAIFSKDRANLKDPQKVDELQNQCVDALLHHWDKNRPDRKPLLGNIFMVLTDLRIVSHKQSLAEENMTFHLKDKFSLDISEIPPLLLEMVSS